MFWSLIAFLTIFFFFTFLFIILSIAVRRFIKDFVFMFFLAELKEHHDDDDRNIC